MHFLLHVKQQLSKGSDSTYMTAATDSQIQLNTPIQEQIPQRKQIHLLMLSILTPDQTWMDEGLEEEKKSRLTPIYLDREKVVQEAQLSSYGFGFFRFCEFSNFNQSLLQLLFLPLRSLKHPYSAKTDQSFTLQSLFLLARLALSIESSHLTRKQSLFFFPRSYV